MLSTQIILHENKRLKTIEDKIKLTQLQKDIFDLNIDVSTTMKKKFQTINKLNQVETKRNIAFLTLDVNL